MHILQGANEKIQRITGDAGDLEIKVSWMDFDPGGTPGSNVTPGGDILNLTDAATSDIIPAVGAGDFRNVRQISARNNDPVSQPLTFQETDGSTTVILWEGTLLADEKVEYTETGEWIVYDANGLPKVAAAPIATQTEMEAAALNTVLATPGNMHWHPGVAKCWGKANGAGTSLTVNYNISGISDTGTGRLGVTIGTDFSSANYAINAALERTVTSLTATGVEDHAIRNASPAAGSFEIESYDQTAILFAAQDPNNYFWACHGDQ